MQNTHGDVFICTWEDTLFKAQYEQILTDKIKTFKDAKTTKMTGT